MSAPDYAPAFAAAIELAVARSEWARRFEGQSIVEVTSISMPYMERIRAAQNALDVALAQLAVGVASQKDTP
jgi:hypothetical protein